MKKHWWKALGVALVLYSFFIGLLTPLKTGIEEVAPQSLQAGSTVTLKVKGYNSFYNKDEKKLRAWLKSGDSTAIAVTNLKVLSDRELEMAFTIPPFLPTNKGAQRFTLLIDSPHDGASVYPDGIEINQDSINPTLGKFLWNARIHDLHEKEGITFPYRTIIYESIRNTYYHVPLWFAMFFLFIAAVVVSIRYLHTLNQDFDHKATALTSVGILFGMLGLATGAVWAKHTWGAYWSFDVKQNMTAIGLLIYCAYFVLRGSFEDPEKKARISAVYNIFAFATLIPLLYVIPKLTDSLHPGAGGNIAFGSEDLDNTMRMVFYPAIIGWTLMGVWMAQLLYRMTSLQEKIFEEGA